MFGKISGGHRIKMKASRLDERGRCTKLGLIVCVQTSSGWNDVTQLRADGRDYNKHEWYETAEMGMLTLLKLRDFVRADLGDVHC